MIIVGWLIVVMAVSLLLGATFGLMAQLMWIAFVIPASVIVGFMQAEFRR